jgi:hypothetical protein
MYYYYSSITIVLLHLWVTVVTIVSTEAYRPSIYDTPGSGRSLTTSSSATVVNKYIQKRYHHNGAVPRIISSTMTTKNGRSIDVAPSITTTNQHRCTTTTTTRPTNEQSMAVRTNHVRRPKWGMDNTFPEEYWFDDRIHTLGNHGFWGAVHAAMAPISTKIIDMAAYDGIDIRKQVKSIYKIYIAARSPTIILSRWVVVYITVVVTILSYTIHILRLFTHSCTTVIPRIIVHDDWSRRRRR